eukprot:Sdes_comp10252_c0_seq1m1888
MDSAFPIAAVAVGIMIDFPEMKDRIMARFYQKCPFIASYYMRFPPNTHDDEKKRLLGYSQESSEKETQWESQEKYIERMCGITTLFAAIIQTEWSSSSSNPQNCNPLGIDFGWKWLARILNQNPTTITPSLLVCFLQVAGHQLFKVYRKQFAKLVNFIAQDFLPKMNKKKSMGAITRLELFLEKSIKQGTIPPPEGRNLSS